MIRVRKHRRGRRRLITTRSALTLALAGAVLAGGGASAWALTRGSGSDYRTATAELGNVSQTLDTTGTLQSADSAQMDFQVSGQVASVPVSVGQQVSEGEVLATLDTSALTSSVATAESTVTSSQEKLQSDENSESDTGSSTTTSTTTPSSTKSSGTAQSGGANSAAVSTAQAALTSDQRTIDTDSAQARSDLSTASFVCSSSTSTSTQGSGTQSSSPSASESPAANGAPGGGNASTTTTTIAPNPGSTSAPCTSALQQVLADQDAVAHDEQVVSQDESQLARLVTTVEATSPSSATPGQNTLSTPSSTGSAPASSSAATPDEIAADQATLDAAEAELSVAQTSLAEGQLTSPIAGTVASVGLTPGQSVSAGSANAEIVVIGPETFDAVATVSVTNLNSVEISQTAYVSPDGQTGQLVGKVTEISPSPSSSSSSSYAVTVSLPAGTAGLHDGASVTVSIVEGQASNVLTVPTSAVHHLGSFASVSELRNGKPQSVNVTLGIMGNDLTQIKSGLAPGDSVVIANVSQPVPTSNSTGGFAGVGALSGGGGAGFPRG